MVTNQSVVDGDTEKRINEAISALASQNIAPIQPKKKARVSGQLYFTPTVSYRKLTENKRVFNGTSYYIPVIDLNNKVKHKPAMGLEFGFEGRYHVSKSFSIKTGLQFNINRYDISAYSHPTEIATVALNSGFGVDSLATLTNYRNSNTTSANWLENFYFQTSIPVGAENNYPGNLTTGIIQRKCAVSIDYFLLLRVAPTLNPIAYNFSFIVNAFTKLERC